MKMLKQEQRWIKYNITIPTNVYNRKQASFGPFFAITCVFLCVFSKLSTFPSISISIILLLWPHSLSLSFSHSVEYAFWHSTFGMLFHATFQRFFISVAIFVTCDTDHGIHVLHRFISFLSLFSLSFFFQFESSMEQL